MGWRRVKVRVRQGLVSGNFSYCVCSPELLPVYLLKYGRGIIGFVFVCKT